MITATLHEAVAAVAPIHGVSIGRRTDRATWTVQFAPEATPQQQSAAAQVLAAFESDDAPAPAPPAAPPLDPSTMTMGQILANASNGPDPLEPLITLQEALQQLGDEEAAITTRLSAGQMRYETAMSARNGGVQATALLEPEATTRGITVAVLAEEIIADRDARVAKTMAVSAAAARHRATLSAAAPANLETLVAAAVAELRALEG